MTDGEATRAAFHAAITLIRDSILGLILGAALLAAACGSACAIAVSDLAGRARVGLRAATQDPK